MQLENISDPFKDQISSSSAELNTELADRVMNKLAVDRQQNATSQQPQQNTNQDSFHDKIRVSTGSPYDEGANQLYQKGGDFSESHFTSLNTNTHQQQMSLSSLFGTDDGVQQNLQLPQQQQQPPSINNYQQNLKLLSEQFQQQNYPQQPQLQQQQYSLQQQQTFNQVNPEDLASNYANSALNNGSQIGTSTQITKSQQQMFSNFINLLKSNNDIDHFSQQMMEVFLKQLNTKSRNLAETLYSFFKDQIEILYQQIATQEWSNTTLQNQQLAMIKSAMGQIYQNVNVGNEYHAQQQLKELNDFLTNKQRHLEILLDDIASKMQNAMKYSIESIQQQLIKEDTIYNFFITKQNEENRIKQEQIAKQSFKDKMEPSGLQLGGMPHTIYSLKKNSHTKKKTLRTGIDSSHLLNIKNDEGYHPCQGGNGLNNKEDIRFMKREDDLKKTFNTSSSNMECFSGFQEVEDFIKRIFQHKNVITLASSFKKVQQVFVLKMEDGRPKVHEVHLINQESIIQLHFTHVPPHYLIVTTAMFLTSARLNVLMFDCQDGELICKKELVSPNPSQIKTYFNDPHFCILYGRAKLLLLNIKQLLQGQNQEFQEIQTMLNFKQNYKIQIQPIPHRGPSDLVGFHYSSQSRINEIFTFQMQTITDSLQLKLWMASNDPAVEKQIKERGRLEVMAMKKSEIKENEIPNKTYNYGTVALNADKILIFGGISEQQGTSRDTCYLYDLKLKRIDKCADLLMVMKDAFANDNYSYFEDEHYYVIPGRYYIHALSKDTMTWEIVDAQMSPVQYKSECDMKVQQQQTLLDDV